MDNNLVYEWILPVFTASERAQSVQLMAAHLSPLLHSGSTVLDLCCGGGPASFWFEEMGAVVTALDFAPYMISLAKEEAAARSSSVTFIEADVFSYDLGTEAYDLITCFGNSISDFPLGDFARLVKKVARALKPGGRFALQYHDGSYRYIQGIAAREGIYQETPERITYRFKEYLPEIGACVNTIRNETRGTEYHRQAYIYTVPVVSLVMGNMLLIEQHIILEENHFLDIFYKPAV